MLASLQKGGLWLAYSFHPKATASVHHFKEVLVLLAAEPAELRNFEIGPEVAHVVGLSLH